jgi:hypothetical protein
VIFIDVIIISFSRQKIANPCLHFADYTGKKKPYCEGWKEHLVDFSTYLLHRLTALLAP